MVAGRIEMSVEIHDSIYWIGKVDEREVPFHRLTLTKGTTYNSYLIKSEKPTVIDTVDISFGKEFRENLEKEINLSDIRYIVINHTEPDHSGGLMALAAKAVNAVIVCTESAVFELKEMYRLHERDFLVVKTGDSLDIGGKTLQFFETPYLHTRETMVTYCPEDNLLFSCDIFSTHVAGENRFDDEESSDILEDFTTYYQLIMAPHRLYVRNLIDILSGLDITMIAPSHGYILRDHARRYIDLYDELSRNIAGAGRGVILYSTMTGNTKKIAQAIQEMYELSELPMSLLDVDRTETAEILKAVDEADIVFVGSSTRYADMSGKLEEVLKALKVLDLSGTYGAAFGSYGWSGEPLEIIQDYLEELGFRTFSTHEIIKNTGMTDVNFPIRIRFSLNEENRKQLERAVYYTIEQVSGKGA